MNLPDLKHANVGLRRPKESGTVATEFPFEMHNLVQDGMLSRQRMRSRQWVIAGAIIAWLAVLMVGNIYARLIVLASSGQGFAPAWSDEFVYAASARSFAANGVLHEAVLLSESTAKLWGLGSHGFVYTLLDGYIIRAFGPSSWGKIGFNYGLAAFALALIAWQTRGMSLGRKGAALLVLLTSFILPIYLFTYMQEVSHLTIAVVVWTLVAGMTAPAARRWTMPAFWIVIMLASLARPNWVLATLGLVAFARNRRQVVGFATLSMVSIAIIAVTVPLFNAPYPFGFLPNALAALPQEGWTGFATRVFGNVWANLLRYFLRTGSPSIFYFAAKYFYSAAVAYLLFVGWRRRNPLALSAGLMGFSQWLALCFFYDAYDWREHRILAPFIVMAGLAINQCCSVRAIAAYLIAAVAIWSGFSNLHAKPMLTDHLDAAMNARQHSGEAAAIAGLGGAIADQETATVILPTGSLARSVVMNALPVRSAGRAPIRYTINLDGEPYGRHGKLPVRYAMLPPNVHLPGAVVLYATDYFTLTRLPGDPKPPPPGVTIRTTSPAAAAN